MRRDAPAIQFQDYRVHPDQGLTRRGREIRVTPKSLGVLYTLARHASRVVTKPELFAEVWPGRVVTDAALSSCIAELREALEDDARNPRFIETVHRRGFRLLEACRIVPLDTTGQDAGTVTARRDLEPTADEASANPAPHSAIDAEPSIVVLPFESLGGGERENVLARGLVHDIIARLARSRTMLVIARGTAFQFRSGRQDVRRIGEMLRVGYVVQGAVQVVGNRMKISVALVHAPTRSEIWTEQYQRDLADFMLIQEEVAESIVAALESEVERAEVRRSLLMPSSNLDAWSAYHRGIHYAYRFRREDCDKAEHWFLRSIETEPGVPRPYAGLSFVHFERAFLNFDRDRSIAADKALDYALQSLSIDPRDPMGHWALSRAYLVRGELEPAKQSAEVAVELNPSYAIAQYSLGWVALQLGENQLCLDRVGFARRLSPYDPLRFAMLGVHALNLALMGRTGEAASLAAQSARQPNVHHHALAFAAVTHALDGQVEKASEFLKGTRAVSPGYDIDDFLATFPFQLERDIERVRKAFDSMRRGLRGSLRSV